MRDVSSIGTINPPPNQRWGGGLIAPAPLMPNTLTLIKRWLVNNPVEILSYLSIKFSTATNSVLSDDHDQASVVSFKK